MDINEIIKEIIPPNDYQYREGFSNEPLIDNLGKEDKIKLEKELINMLQDKSDMLIVESLAYLKSRKSLPILYELLSASDIVATKIILASSIFQINYDNKMIEIAKSSFKKITDKYELIPAFYYLIKFHDSEIYDLIQEYTQDTDYLISYNARQVLGNS